MDIATLKKNHKLVVSNLHQRKILRAIKLLRLQAQKSGKEYFLPKIEPHEFTYHNILKHSFGKIKDPARDQVYQNLIKEILELTDALYEHLHTDFNSNYMYQQKRLFLKTRMQDLAYIQEYIDNADLDSPLHDVLGDIQLEENTTKADETEVLTKSFNLFWLTDVYGLEEKQLLSSIMNSASFPQQGKSLIISAIGLSSIRYFDIPKIALLFDFVNEKEDHVWQRALLTLFLIFMHHQDRSYLYPQLQKMIEDLQEGDDMEKNLEALLIQFTKTKETESVTKKWEEDILPQMMKFRPRLEQKLDLDNIFKDEFGEEKNPDWETVFEDAPDLMDKLQEFTELQMDGMDVFMSAFSRLKSFPFFQKISNWFIPFYHTNTQIQPYLNQAGSNIDMTPLVKRLEDTYFMCNSDKYSFSFNLAMIPDEQKNMIMNMTKAEMDSINEVEKGEGLINQFSKTKSIYTQYFQDLYRFHKLHPDKNAFEDVFKLEPDLFENIFIKKLISGTKTIRNIGEFYFDKKFYPYALKVFVPLLERDSKNIELFEKIAFCYERTGNFEKALEYYKKAELFETGKLWIINKMALCSKYLNRWDDALRYYKEAEQADPENLKTQAHIAQCHIHLQEYEKALDIYFKIEVLAPENHKIRRPLAWCAFVLGKFDTASDYLSRLLAENPEQAFDFITLGHVHWCSGKQGDALEAYRKAILILKDFSNFEKAFNEDRKSLQQHLISELEMDLMLEYLQIVE